MNIKKQIKKNCLYCNKEYFVIPYRSKKTKCCSQECITKYKTGKNNPNWRGGATPPSIYLEPIWRKQSRDIMKRDNYTCQVCGVKQGEARLEVNHILPYRIIKSHIPQNLVTLCKKHHANMDWMVRDLLNLHPARIRFLEIIGEMWQTNIRKSGDYATQDDPLSNLKIAEQFGLKGSMGVFIRMGDKMSRISQLAQREGLVIDEGIKDTLIDLATYAILAIVIIEGEEEEDANKTA